MFDELRAETCKLTLASIVYFEPHDGAHSPVHMPYSLGAAPVELQICAYLPE